MTLSPYFLERQAKAMGNNKPVEEKPKKGIAKQSEKRKVDQKEYRKIVKEMIAANPFCEIKSPICTGKDTGLDHIQKRGPNNFLERANLQRACHECNGFKEQYPEWANENGKSKSRFKN